MAYELLIQSGGSAFYPSVEDGVTWKTTRKGAPGELNFSVLKDQTISFQEGDPVAFRMDGTEVFYGYVFTKQRSKDGRIQVTAFDQLRYLKNKTSVLEDGVKASDLLTLMARDFQLQTGEVEDTVHVIGEVTEKNKTLFDILQDALDETLQATGKLYCLYDAFGKLTLKNVERMKTDYLIEADSAEDFDYSSSIDSDTYNQIKLTYDNEETGIREKFMAKNSAHQNQWGVLQYYEDLKSPLGAAAKADALLKFYDQKTRTLTVKNLFGRLDIRAGASVAVHLNLGDIITSNYMVVEQATHTFNESEHWMDLKLIGGEFIA